MVDIIPEHESGFLEKHISLRKLIESQIISQSVVDLLLPESFPHAFETVLWDYKSEFPSLPEMPTAQQKLEQKAKIADITKDVVSFYNSFGGYIVFGVKDHGQNRVVGCDEILDMGDFNQRIQSSTSSNVECLLSIFEVAGKNVPIMLIPRRPSNVIPVVFKRNGPKHVNGKASFNKGAYIRFRDQCRPAAAKYEDWQFLQSDRNIESGEIGPNPRSSIPAKLPSRDVDLVEFVGRRDTLVSLRDWLSDIRSPVRLLTGIGGLGKTTIAYKFAEEVLDSSAAGIERLIWVTAKKTTFSALRGELVETNSVDFTGIHDLFEQLIIEIAGHGSVPVEETLSDLTDALVDALKYYSCLIIVDDLDSLPPSEQRQCAAELQQVASRTVDRDCLPTRILMTSRLDQGLPPTAILQIDGLDRDAFDKHVQNLCGMFKVPTVNPRTLKTMYKTTSGSPLFVGSLIKLVHLGENAQDVCEKWKDSDGEDVREFAFRRELERLNWKAASALFAVILLGESSLEDLESVLEFGSRSTRDTISELQAFHLIARTENKFGDTVLSTPKELISVTGILKKYLGTRARLVERGCARIRSENRGGAKAIGIQIRKIIDFWDKENFDEAIVVARKLSTGNPKNGDVASVLGAAYLKAKPPKFREANEVLEKSMLMGCQRRELLANLIKAKVGIEDWQGLLSTTEKLSTNGTKDDEPLDGFILASAKLIGIAKLRGDSRRWASLSISSIERIEFKISNQSLAPQYFIKLRNEQMRLSKEYIEALHSENPRPGDKLDVFSGVLKLVNARVVTLGVIKNLCESLSEWWRDVENRPVLDLKACDILHDQLFRLLQIPNLISSDSPQKEEILRIVEDANRDLGFRGAALRLQDPSHPS